MERTSDSDRIYRGEVLEAALDPEDYASLADLEDALRDDFDDLEPGEELYVSLSDGHLVVKKLREL
jgi:hypothetical protein